MDPSQRNHSLVPGKASQCGRFLLLHLRRIFRSRQWDKTVNRLLIDALLRHAVSCFPLMTVGGYI